MPKIDRDIPLPKTKGGRPISDAVQYPFGEMDVGESVLYEMGADTPAWRSRPYYAARKYGQRSGKKFAIRKVDGGIRIWRVE